MPEPLLYLKATTIAAIASALFVLAMTSASRPASAKWRESASILGIGLGLALGFYVLSWRWVWPPANGLDRLLTIVVPADLPTMTTDVRICGGPSPDDQSCSPPRPVSIREAPQPQQGSNAPQGSRE